ncbi:hypothetical protein ABH935_007013 [Catenulispora sp. GAS73]|uniref:hypothetical protein n=1 Tax=Catenulispora sp. GAS73 TaxID=3156269 RepID=UPI0035177E41
MLTSEGLDDATGEQRAPDSGSASSSGFIAASAIGTMLWLVVLGALYGWSHHAATADYFGVPGSAIYQDWGVVILPALLICMAAAVAWLVLAVAWIAIAGRRGRRGRASRTPVAAGLAVVLAALSLATAWAGGDWWARHQLHHDVALQVLTDQSLCPPHPSDATYCVLVGTHGNILYTRWISVATGQLGSDLKQVSMPGYDMTTTRFLVVLPVKN